MWPGETMEACLDRAVDAANLAATGMAASGGDLSLWGLFIAASFVV